MPFLLVHSRVNTYDILATSTAGEWFVAYSVEFCVISTHLFAHILYSINYAAQVQ